MRRNVTLKSVQKILDSLEEEECMSRREVFLDTNVNWNSLNSALNWLKNYGLVEEEGGELRRVVDREIVEKSSDFDLLDGVDV